MPSRVTDHDIIIAFQTLKWSHYDVSIDLDLAAHNDYDVHVSLLYDVGEDEPTDYTGIRVGYPADDEQRIGFLTPPASPRKFLEETVEDSIEASNKYIGDIEVSPTGTDLGIKQALVMRNATGIAQVSVVDSPIMNEVGKTFDATEWIDRVPVILTRIESQKQLPADTLFWYFDRLDYFHTINDDVYFDFEHLVVEGDIYFHYTDDLHIKQYQIHFFGGLDPQDYEIFGIGEDTSNNIIRVHIRQEVPVKTLFYGIKQKGSFRLYLLVRNKAKSYQNYEYRWIALDYGFGDLSYMNDYVLSHVWRHIAESVPALARIESSLKVPSYQICEHISDNIGKKGFIYSSIFQPAQPGRPELVTTGTVLSTKIFDTVYYDPDDFHISHISAKTSHTFLFPDAPGIKIKVVTVPWSSETIESSGNYSIDRIKTTHGRAVMANWI
jgi:hypothetical protein